MTESKGVSTKNRRNVVDRSVLKDELTPLSALNLHWVPYSWTSTTAKGARGHRKTSKAWDFMGQLVKGDVLSGASNSSQHLNPVVSDLLYCRMCFEEQSLDPHGLLSKVYSTAKTTSSGNHLSHAVSKHGKLFEKTPKIQQQQQQQEVQVQQPADWQSKSESEETVLMVNHTEPDIAIPYDFNKDIVLLACADMQPFSLVENTGFKNFCDKHVGFELPAKFHMASTSLHDVYSALKAKVMTVLGSCVGGTVMLDRWTDRTNDRQLFAVRFSFVHEWIFQVVTLAVKVVDDFKPQTLAPVIKDVLSEFLPHSRRCVLFETTYATNDMKQLSLNLGHDNITCIAHSIHLLVTVDSIWQITQLQQVLVKCIELVNVIHSKSHIADSIELQPTDIEFYERLMDCQSILTMDKSDPVPVDVPSTSVDSTSCLIPSRWTVILQLVEIMLDMHKITSDVLKRIGRSDLCLSTDDIELLAQVRNFLSPFEQFTMLISECSPNLTLVPLVRTRMQKMCVQMLSDCAPMVNLKRLVAASIDKRLPITEHIKLIVCFDPAVRDVILPRSDCEELLTVAFKKLSGCPGVTELFTVATSKQQGFDESLAAGWTGIKPDVESAQLTSASSAAKRLRLSLLMESIPVAAGPSPVDKFGLADEIRRYMAIHDEAPALEFWKLNADSFPVLSTMACIYLAVSPGSVQFGRLFSTNGLRINYKMTTIAPYRLNIVSFIHDNAQLFI